MHRTPNLDFQREGNVTCLPRMQVAGSSRLFININSHWKRKATNEHEQWGFLRNLFAAGIGSLEQRRAFAGMMQCYLPTLAPCRSL